MNVRKLLSALPLLLLCTSAHGQCAGVTSCTVTPATQTGLQNTLASINLDGTIVNVPNGIVITSTVNYTQTNTFILQGGGAISGTGLQATIAGTGSDVTTINFNTTTDVHGLAITTIAGKAFGMAGIAFHSLNTITSDVGLVWIGGLSTAIRINNNHFNQLNNVGLYFAGCVNGVTDHNQFDQGFFNENSIRATDPNCLGEGAPGYGNGSWADSSHFGTSQFMFIENNNFRYTGTASATCSPSINAHGYAIDVGLDGGRVVFRYNAVGFHVGIQTHGTSGGTQTHRGLRASEFYNNSFNYTTVPGDCFAFVVQLEGGENLWYNNTTSGFLQYIHNDVVRVHNTTYGETATPNGWGYCGTTQTGVGSNWDQSATGTGYACLDSTGRGQGDLLTGNNSFPTLVNQTTGTIAWPHQVLRPVYVWSSPVTPVPNNPFTYFANASGAVTVENRDYYLQLPNHEEAAIFNGTAGIGCGPTDAFCTSAVTRPATCTTGVAFWNTTTSILSQCTSTNTWTNFYSPFTYPHPLIGGASPVIGFNPNPVAFGNVNLGTNSSLVVTATNSGTAGEVLSAATTVGGTDLTLVSTTCNSGSTITANGGTCATTVKCAPTATSLRTGTLNLTGTINASVNITCTGVNSISIPAAPTGASAAANGSTITVTWTASTGTPTGYNVSRATVNGGPYSLIANLGLVTSYVDFGLSANTYYYVITASNSAGTSSFSNQASATVVATIPSANVNPISINFGTVIIGSTNGPPSQPITLSSIGTATLSSIVVGNPSLPDFAQTNNCGGTLAVGSNCTITPTFTPSTSGLQTSTLCVTSNDPNSPDCVVLTGTGQGAVLLSPPSITMANTYTTKTSATAVLNYTNQSGVTITISSISFSTGDAAIFSTTNDCGGSVLTGVTCHVNITFTPTSNGTKTTNLIITDSAGGSPRTIVVTGSAKGHHILKVGVAI